MIRNASEEEKKMASTDLRTLENSNSVTLQAAESFLNGLCEGITRQREMRPALVSHNF